jgi:hypothetical protein
LSSRSFDRGQRRVLSHSNCSAIAEQWAARIPAPTYAIDDQTAIKVTDGVNVEVVSEGNWRLFTPWYLDGQRIGSRSLGLRGEPVTRQFREGWSSYRPVTAHLTAGLWAARTWGALMAR